VSAEAKKAPLLQLDHRGKPTFRYVRAAETDLAATFARIRRQQKEAAAAPPSNVRRMEAKKGR
jgi:hypothetical protein